VRIYAGSDHAGFSLRKTVVERLRAQGKEVVDLGTDSDTACDYPEFAYAVANKVRSEPGAMGILVCATGQGMAMAAGKVRGIRAAAPSTIECARLSRIDNNANVLCLAGRRLSEAEALAMVDTWLATSFAGGRHARRIAKVAAIETASAVAFVTESERLQLSARGFPSKLFARDPSLLSDDPLQHARIRPLLAWASLPQEIGDKVPEIMAFAEQVRQARFKDVVLLFDADEDGPASLCDAWGAAGMRLHVVRAGSSQSPSSIEDAVHLSSTLVLACSTAPQMGSDLQGKEQHLWSKMLDHCLGNAQRAGQHFAAVTTSGSGLAQLATVHRYAKVFIDPVTAGDAFGVLGFAGLVPATLAGLDPARLVAKAKAMAEACRGQRLEENPGASLGVLLGSMAKHGRYKLTVLASKSLEPLVQWISLLLTLATRDAGRRIEVMSGESLRPSYPADRIFVHLQAPGDPSAIPQESMEALHIAGQPYIQIVVPDKLELTAEIFRWQVAAVAAAMVLGTNPFAGARSGADPGQVVA
jgi:RpiB/LacA/LacB family sugar-phosphate isomerase